MKVFTISTNILSQKKAELLLNLLPHYYKIKEITFSKRENKGVFEIKANDLRIGEINTVFNDFGYKCEVN